MPNPLLSLRYSVFALLTISFAVQAAFAVVNLHIKQRLVPHASLDAFLIFCGVAGLVTVLPVTVVDLFRKNALLTRVWVEVAWLATFFVFEVAGSAALTALFSDMACGSRGTSRDPACQSTSILTGFTWAITVIVLFYMGGLVISAILHQGNYSNVWHTGVRDFPWYETSFVGQRELPNSPRRSFPSKTEAKEESWAVPSRAAAVPSSRSRSSGPGQPHYRTTSQTMMQTQPQSTSVPVSWRAPPKAGPTTSASVSLYGRHIDSAAPVFPAQSYTPSAPSSATLSSSSSDSSPRTSNDSSSSSPTTAQRTPRTGPKRKPPPLDLSKLSSFNR